MSIMAKDKDPSASAVSSAVVRIEDITNGMGTGDVVVYERLPKRDMTNYRPMAPIYGDLPRTPPMNPDFTGMLAPRGYFPLTDIVSDPPMIPEDNDTDGPKNNVTTFDAFMARRKLLETCRIRTSANKVHKRFRIVYYVFVVISLTVAALGFVATKYAEYIPLNKGEYHVLDDHTWISRDKIYGMIVDVKDGILIGCLLVTAIVNKLALSKREMIIKYDADFKKQFKKFCENSTVEEIKKLEAEVS